MSLKTQIATKLVERFFLYNRLDENEELDEIKFLVFGIVEGTGKKRKVKG